MAPRAHLLAWIAVLAGAACGDDQDPQGAADLWQEIHAQDYRSFAPAPGYAARRTSNAPHGDAVMIYVNDVMSRALTSGSPLNDWPVGSLIVKDGFDGDELELVAVMQKREAGWFWAEYDAKGDASYSGSPELCTGCHRSGDDYVRAFSFP